MSYTYHCVKQEFHNEDIGNYITYGIEITEENIIMDDVSCNKEKAENIVELINLHQASPINLDEIIDNLLAA